MKAVTLVVLLVASWRAGASLAPCSGVRMSVPTQVEIADRLGLGLGLSGIMMSGLSSEAIDTFQKQFPRQVPVCTDRLEVGGEDSRAAELLQTLLGDTRSTDWRQAAGAPLGDARFDVNGSLQSAQGTLVAKDGQYIYVACVNLGFPDPQKNLDDDQPAKACALRAKASTFACFLSQNLY